MNSNIFTQSRDEEGLEAEIEDEVKEMAKFDDQSIFKKSIISSHVLSHINNPKSFNDMKHEISSFYNKSEFSVTGEDIRASNQSSLRPFSQNIKTSTEYTDFDDNENRYIETPKSVTISNNNTNPNIKGLADNITKKEGSIRNIAEKINKVKMSIRCYEEENKKICSKIEKEEAEAERLRHILNYLLSEKAI